MWDEKLIEPLKNQINDYPLRMLLDVLTELNQTQIERIEILHGEVDGSAWSPSDW